MWERIIYFPYQADLGEGNIGRLEELHQLGGQAVVSGIPMGPSERGGGGIQGYHWRTGTAIWSLS